LGHANRQIKVISLNNVVGVNKIVLVSFTLEFLLDVGDKDDKQLMILGETTGIIGS
jgi:hypothetical protein